MSREHIEKLVVAKDYKGALDGLVSFNNWDMIKQVKHDALICCKSVGTNPELCLHP